MGYDLDRFESSIDSSLKCPICLKVYENPVQLECSGSIKNGNQHIFCRSCLIQRFASSDTLRCPLDGKKFKRNTRRNLFQIPSQEVFDMISSLLIKCSFQGCSNVSKLNELESHLEVCEYNPNRNFDHIPTNICSTENIENLDAPNTCPDAQSSNWLLDFEPWSIDENLSQPPPNSEYDHFNQSSLSFRTKQDFLDFEKLIDFKFKKLEESFEEKFNSISTSLEIQAKLEIEKQSKLIKIEFQNMFDSFNKKFNFNSKKLESKLNNDLTALKAKSTKVNKETSNQNQDSYKTNLDSLAKKQMSSELIKLRKDFNLLTKKNLLLVQTNQEKEIEKLKTEVQKSITEMKKSKHEMKKLFDKDLNEFKRESKKYLNQELNSKKFDKKIKEMITFKLDQLQLPEEKFEKHKTDVKKLFDLNIKKMYIGLDKKEKKFKALIKKLSNFQRVSENQNQPIEGLTSNNSMDESCVGRSEVKPILNQQNLLKSVKKFKAKRKPGRPKVGRKWSLNKYMKKTENLMITNNMSNVENEQIGENKKINEELNIDSSNNKSLILNQNSVLESKNLESCQDNLVGHISQDFKKIKKNQELINDLSDIKEIKKKKENEKELSTKSFESKINQSKSDQTLIKEVENKPNDGKGTDILAKIVNEVLFKDTGNSETWDSSNIQKPTFSRPFLNSRQLLRPDFSPRTSDTIIVAITRPLAPPQLALATTTSDTSINSSSESKTILVQNLSVQTSNVTNNFCSLENKIGANKEVQTSPFSMEKESKSKAIIENKNNFDNKISSEKIELLTKVNNSSEAEENAKVKNQILLSKKEVLENSRPANDLKNETNIKTETKENHENDVKKLQKSVLNKEEINIFQSEHNINIQRKSKKRKRKKKPKSSLNLKRIEQAKKGSQSLGSNKKNSPEFEIKEVKLKERLRSNKQINAVCHESKNETKLNLKVKKIKSKNILLKKKELKKCVLKINKQRRNFESSSRVLRKRNNKNDKVSLTLKLPTLKRNTKNISNNQKNQKLNKAKEKNKKLFKILDKKSIKNEEKFPNLNLMKGSKDKNNADIQKSFETLKLNIQDQNKKRIKSKRKQPLKKRKRKVSLVDQESKISKKTKINKCYFDENITSTETLSKFHDKDKTEIEYVEDNVEKEIESLMLNILNEIESEFLNENLKIKKRGKKILNLKSNLSQPNVINVTEEKDLNSIQNVKNQISCWRKDKNELISNQIDENEKDEKSLWLVEERNDINNSEKEENEDCEKKLNGTDTFKNDKKIGFVYTQKDQNDENVNEKLLRQVINTDVKSNVTLLKLEFR